MLKRQTVLCQCSRPAWPGVGPSGGLRREPARLDAADHVARASRLRPAGARDRRGSAAGSGRSSRSRDPRSSRRSSRSADRRSRPRGRARRVGSVLSVPSCPSAARRPASGRSARAVRARRACGSGARAGCRPSRSSSRARRAAGSRSRRRSSGARRCRRRGRCRTSRRSPGGRTTRRRRRATRPRAPRANAASDDEHAKCASDWLVGGGGDQGRRFPGRSPRELRGMVQSLSDGIEVAGERLVNGLLGRAVTARVPFRPPC